LACDDGVTVASACGALVYGAVVACKKTIFEECWEVLYMSKKSEGEPETSRLFNEPPSRVDNTGTASEADKRASANKK
jgi:hypothetical protein